MLAYVVVFYLAQRVPVLAECLSQRFDMSRVFAIFTASFCIVRKIELFHGYPLLNISIIYIIPYFM